ncbi:TetR/AcrR family transcriptional regulator [Peptoniphilaceae bacterium SGI.131]
MELINRPKTAKGETTLKNIITAAENVFYKKGYNGSTIRDIAKEAGISVGTIYIYFADKKSIYDHLLLQYSKYIRSNISKRIAGVKSRREAERLGLLVFMEIVKENKHIYNIIWESLYIDKQEFVDYYMNFSKHYKKSLDDAVEGGELSGIDTEILSWVLMGISNFIGLRYVMFSEDTDFEYIVDKVMDILDKGLFNR